MRWRRTNGQAVVETALVIPILLLLLACVLAAGYAAVAEILVVTSAGQGARQGAALCADGQSTADVLDAARQRALDLLAPLAGEKQAGAIMDGPDLVVTSSYVYSLPLPGAKLIGDGKIHLDYTARYRCD